MGVMSMPQQSNKSIIATGPLMSQYVQKLIPEDAIVNFIFKEDFDGDGTSEAVIGYSILEAWDFSVLYVNRYNDGYKHKLVLTTGGENPDSIYDVADGMYGLLDVACVADTNGDGKPELVLALTAGNGHFITPLIFHWEGKVPSLAWRTGEGFYQGLQRVNDVDGDGIYEIIVEHSIYNEYGIIQGSEANPHIRTSNYYKWNGETYLPNQYTLSKPEYDAYNTAANFLISLWNDNYEYAYKHITAPSFLGFF